jgi:hypothetical protein
MFGALCSEFALDVGVLIKDTPNVITDGSSGDAAQMEIGYLRL